MGDVLASADPQFRAHAGADSRTVRLPAKRRTRMSENVAPIHNPFLQHHFTEMEQQTETSKLGMWLFLVTEVLLFGGLFVAYGILSAHHHAAFRAAHEHLDHSLGILNTAVLLLSSF